VTSAPRRPGGSPGVCRAKHMEPALPYPGKNRVLTATSAVNAVMSER
jgi:hypothetical protein